MNNKISKWKVCIVQDCEKYILTEKPYNSCYECNK